MTAAKYVSQGLEVPKSADTLFTLVGYYEKRPILEVKQDPKTGRRWVILHRCDSEVHVSSANGMWSDDAVGYDAGFGRPIDVVSREDSNKTTVLMLTEEHRDPIRFSV